MATRKLAALVEPQPTTLTYHKGHLLTGPIAISLVWYGKFTPAQRAIVADFVSSLSSHIAASAKPEPSVASWWKTAESYYALSNSPLPVLSLGKQVLDESYSLGRSLTSDQLLALAARGGQRRAVNVVLTADDVAVEGFCMSRCGTHGASSRSKNGRFAFVWVGNSASQCPGQCAWPFHQPLYGPQTPPLVAPNGDVGVDGMVINLASMLAGTFTNPFADGFFQGPAEAPLEAASACPGVVDIKILQCRKAHSRPKDHPTCAWAHPILAILRSHICLLGNRLGTKGWDINIHHRLCFEERKNLAKKRRGPPPLALEGFRGCSSPGS